jgi:cytidylate kinase
LELGVENRATIALALQSEAAKGKKTGCARLAAALGINAADTSLV